MYSTHKVEVPEKGNSRVPGTLIKRFVIVLSADKKKPRRAPFKARVGLMVSLLRLAYCFLGKRYATRLAVMY